MNNTKFCPKLHTINDISKLIGYTEEETIEAMLMDDFPILVAHDRLIISYGDFYDWCQTVAKDSGVLMEIELTDVALKKFFDE